MISGVPPVLHEGDKPQFPSILSLSNDTAERGHWRPTYGVGS
jgi:hypothetical protein